MDMRKFLTFCCDEAENREPRRHTTGRPWLIEYNGEVWTVAAKGSYAVAVRGSHTDEPPPDDPMTKKARKNLTDLMEQAVSEIGRASLRELKDWLGEPASLEWEDCDECQGDGKSICPHCEQMMLCDNCGGKGRVLPSVDSFVGVIGDICIDRAKLSHAVRMFSEGEAVSVGVSHQNHGAMIVVNGNGWRVFVMSMDTTNDLRVYGTFRFRPEAVSK